MSLSPIELDRSKYAIGQIVHISQIPHDTDSANVKKYLEINRTHYPSKIPGCYIPFTAPTEQDTFALIELDNSRSNYTFIPNQSGLYVISSYNYLQQKEPQPEVKQEKEFNTIFEVINPIKSTTFIMLIIAIGFFIALVFLTYILSIKNQILNNKKTQEIEEKKIDEKHQNEITKIEEKYQRNMFDYIEIASSIRYLLISALVWSIILALVFTEVEIGTHSPLGLVIRHNLNPEGGELDVTKNPLIDWGVNIGGNWKNNFSSGVVIPIYVLILGLIGGYLRYLHKAATKEKVFSRVYVDKTKEIDEGKEGIKKEYIKKSEKPLEDTSSEFLETTYGELSNIFLAPLLAAVVWFIVSQGQTDFNIYGMAAISFSIGLVTTEIIQLIVKFMERIIPAEKSDN